MARVALLLPYTTCGARGPEVFLQRRSDRPFWAFFGGHVEKGETPLEAVLREAEEELGLDLRKQPVKELIPQHIREECTIRRLPLRLPTIPQPTEDVCKITIQQVLGEGWTVPQLICKLRLPLLDIHLFPIEVKKEFVRDKCTIKEGLAGKWWPVRLPPKRCRSRTSAGADLGNPEDMLLACSVSEAEAISINDARMSVADRMILRVWALRRFVLNQPYVSTPLKSPIITVDLEEPHHYAGRSPDARFANRRGSLPEVITDLLDHLDKAGAKATFFCVRSTALKYRELIQEINKQGHEIAAHSMHHQLVSTKMLSEFIYDVTKCKETLEGITLTEVEGYRAPGWSVPHDTRRILEFYQALREAGCRYDSSVIPMSHMGIPGPAIPYRTEAGIWEFPLPVFGIPLVTRNLDLYAKDGRYRAPTRIWRDGICVPYSGGFFSRFLGSRLSRFIISYHLKKKGYTMTYVHPHELSGEGSSWIRGLDDRYFNLFERWQVGWRTKKAKIHFYRLLANQSGCSIRQFMDNMLTSSAC